MKPLAFIIPLMLILTLTLVSAEMQTLGTFKQKSCITLRQICGNCTQNTITSVSLPNSTVAIADALMIKNGTEYTYQFCNTNETGTYIVNGYGNPTGINEIWAYDFSITPSGTANKTWAFLLIFGVASITLVVLGLAMHNPYFGFIGGMMFLTIGVYSMIYGFMDVTDLYTQGFSMMLIGLGTFFTIVAAYEWAADEFDFDWTASDE